MSSISNCFCSISACFILSIIYVASLYIWSSNQPRDHPSTIKRRFCSVFVMMFISPLFLYSLTTPEISEKSTIWELLGFRTKGIILATIIPLILTMVLFLGPICMMYDKATNITNITESVTNLIWLRNHIVAPLSEEFTFRACMLPLLQQCFNCTASVLICPLFFGVAHFHHMLERLKSGIDLKTAVFISSFQFLYTTLFGIYSAFLFARTGHFVAPFVAHAFCNHMGFPNFQEVFAYDKPRRRMISMMFIVGLITWSLMLKPLTEPSLYENEMYEYYSKRFVN